MMELGYLTQPTVRKITFQLKWGDKFENDLCSSLEELTDESENTFSQIRDRLVEEKFVYRLRGGDGSYYLSLTDMGQSVVDRLYEIELILATE